MGWTKKETKKSYTKKDDLCASEKEDLRQMIIVTPEFENSPYLGTSPRRNQMFSE